MWTDVCWPVLLLVLLLIGVTEAWRRRQHPRSAPVAAQRQRLLKPRTPDACPACRQQVAPRTGTTPADAPVTPWRERKSRRGAPKRSDTQGFACPNRTGL